MISRRLLPSTTSTMEEEETTTSSPTTMSEMSLYWSDSPVSSRRSSSSSIPSPTHFNIKAGLSTSTKLSKADKRRLQVFEEHILKHNPVQHGQRLCQKCEKILGQKFTSDMCSSTPSSSCASSR